MKKPTTMLLILDGYGVRSEEKGNAVIEANTPNLDKYFSEYPNTLLKASGLSVGLPEGQMGNSEVGHLNIGAGRIIYQDLTRINKEIQEGNFFKNKAFLKAIDYSKRNNSSVHIMGLLSNGGVHSHIDHLKALLTLCKNQEVKSVYLHGFLDGRDVAPQSALEFIEDIESFMSDENIGKIATLSGRYYSMDRDNRWDRVEKAYRVMFDSKGNTYESAKNAIESSYSDGVSDEFLLPSIILDENGNSNPIKEKDSIIFFNFRPDRAREITRSIIERNFHDFAREYKEVYFVAMTQYDSTFENLDIAYMPESYVNTLGEYLSVSDKRQLRIAETEKYAHVTFFFNGGVEEPNIGEDRILVPSPKVATYDLKPEMSADEVTERVLTEIEKGYYDFILLNFANPDMVGHTGDFNAAKAAVETVDICTKKIVDELGKINGTICITADHGNAEQMVDPSTGEKFTAHTTSLVPFTVIGKDVKLEDNGILADISPTILEIMGLEVPSEMTGKSLIINKGI